MDRAADYESAGRRFESCQEHQVMNHCCMCDKPVDRATAIPVSGALWVHPEACRAAWVAKELLLDQIFADVPQLD